MHTLAAEFFFEAESRLRRNAIVFIVRKVNDSKINIFFGDPDCVAVVASFGDKPLNVLSPEEDFMLGIMLGYSRIEQCRRYLKRSGLGASGKSREAVYSTASLRSVSA